MKPLGRSFRAFLGFCVLLLLGVLVARVWIGPVMWALMFDDGLRASPLTAVSFLARVGDAEGGIDAKSREVLAMMRAEGASVTWFGGTQLVMNGTVTDEWERVAAIRFDEGAGFVDVVTSGAYRDLLSAEPQTRQLLLVATSAPTQPIAKTARVVLFLFAHGDSKAPRTAINRLVASSLANGGRVVWQTDVDVLRGDGNFGALVAVQFRPDVGIEHWLGDEQAALDRNLARQTFEQVVVSVLEPLAAPEQVDG